MAKSKTPAAAAAKNGNGDNKPIRNLNLVDGSGYLFRWKAEEGLEVLSISTIYLTFT